MNNLFYREDIEKLKLENKKLKELLELATGEAEAFRNFLENLIEGKASLDSDALLRMLQRRKHIKKEMEG